MHKRLFVAIPLPLSLKAELSECLATHKHLRSVRWIPEQNWHVTCCFLGKTQIAAMDAVCDALRTCAKGADSFHLDFEVVRWFPSRRKARMIWAAFKPAPEFEGIVRSIHRGLAEFLDLQPMKNRPIPHVTLARMRDKKPVGDREEIACSSSACGFRVEGFELWESRLNSEGAVYRSLHEFPFSS